MVVPSSMPSKKGIAKAAVLVGFMVRNENRNMPDAGMPGWRDATVGLHVAAPFVVLGREGLVSILYRHNFILLQSSVKVSVLI